jgi:hypothetical protein
MRKMSKKTMLLCIFIVAKIALQYFLINPFYDLHRDEYLHLDQAKHLAWGYESVPPFTSWISWIILQLGNNVFWVKFFPALFGALSILVVWKATEILKGNLFSLVLGATAMLLSALLRMNLLFQPNSFDILCWTCLYFCFIKYFQSGGHKWLLMAAVAFAIGFLNKYNIVFLVAGFIPALLLTEQRKIFFSKNLYVALGLAVLLISPNLVWQYQHHFPVVHHLKTLSATQLVNVNRLDFLKEQLLYFLGSLFILPAALISFFRFPEFKKYRAFFWALVFTLVIFTYLKAKGYYAIGLYPIFISFGAVYLEHILQSGWRFYLRPVAILVIFILFLPFFKIAFPIKTPAEIAQNNAALKSFGLLRWEDGKDHQLPQDFSDMLGWTELARKTDLAFDAIADKEHTLVLCDNYGQAGAINYYSRHKNIGAVSMSADYINWFPLDKKEIKNVILIQDASDDDPGRAKERQLFKTVNKVGEIENPYAREKGCAIYVLIDANTSINKILNAEIEKEKNRQ